MHVLFISSIQSGMSRTVACLFHVRIPAAVHSVVQKLCSILAFLKDLLSVVRLSDSCILQLVKTSFSTFLVDNIQLLQLKSINLICGVISILPSFC